MKKSQIGPVALIITILLMFLSIYFVAESTFEKKEPPAKAILEDYIKYQKALYYIFIYSGYLIRYSIYNFIYDILLGKENILSGISNKEILEFYSNNCKQTEFATFVYENNIWNIKYCIPLMPLLNTSLFEEIFYDKIYNRVIENLEKNRRKEYAYINITSYIRNPENLSIGIKFHYDMTYEDFKRNFTIIHNYYLIPHILEYNYYISLLYSKLESDMISFLNRTPEEIIKDIYEFDQSRDLLTKNLSIPIEYKTKLVLYNPEAKDLKLYVELPINCSYFGIWENGKCVIPTVYNSVLDENVTYYYECFLDNLIKDVSYLDITEYEYKIYNFSGIERQIFDFPINIPPDFLNPLDSSISNKLLQVLNFSAEEYGYYIPKKYYPIAYIEYFLFDLYHCKIGYVKKEIKPLSYIDCLEIIKLITKDPRYGFYIKNVSCTPKVEDTQMGRIIYYILEYYERSKVIDITKDIPLYRILSVDNIFSQITS